MIARALAVEPRVMLGDEPESISMLDVSIRLDVLNLLKKLRDEEGLALLYITHDIASARYIADRINVMYAGQMVEGGSSEEVIHDPQHPYTRLLLDSSPDPGRGLEGDQQSLFDEVGDLGEPPSLITPPKGCRFNPRCPFAMDICNEKEPEKVEVSPGHWAKCWLHQEGRADLLKAAEHPVRGPDRDRRSGGRDRYGQRRGHPGPDRRPRGRDHRRPGTVPALTRVPDAGRLKPGSRG